MLDLTVDAITMKYCSKVPPIIVVEPCDEGHSMFNLKAIGNSRGVNSMCLLGTQPVVFEFFTNTYQLSMIKAVALWHATNGSRCPSTLLQKTRTLTTSLYHLLCS